MENKILLIELLEKSKHKLAIVEGKKDKEALEGFGFGEILCLNSPLYEIIEKVERANKKEVILLTDLDKEGKKLYHKLKSGLQRNGIYVDDKIRNLLFKTGLRHIEGLTRFLQDKIN